MVGRLRLTRDLQTKIAEDMTNAAQRVMSLTDDPEIQVTVVLQAASTVNRLLAQTFEHAIGRDRTPPSDSALVFACLLSARVLLTRRDAELLDLMAAADRDVVLMKRAEIVFSEVKP